MRYWMPSFHCPTCPSAGEPDKILSTIRAKFVPTILAGYTVWPLAHLINFRYISGQQRILYINVVNVSAGWHSLADLESCSL